MDPTPNFRNVGSDVKYVGDKACFNCHEEQYRGFQSHGMAQSFGRYSSASSGLPRGDTTLIFGGEILYRVLAGADSLVQIETTPTAVGTNQLARRASYVVGSGNAARTYLAENNGRLFELPVTWYAESRHWDLSPGYKTSNARFDRQVPDRCMACHNSYPMPVPFVDGKYTSVPDGIGCERCHGPGALHVDERLATPEPAAEIDDSIVNPAHLDIDRRNAVCQQCHLHTTVSVLRRGHAPFDFQPSERLSDHIALFFEPETGSRDGVSVVSHVDRLQQSACFLETRESKRPIECVTCHDPHQGFRSLGPEYFNRTCEGCHAPDVVMAKAAPPYRANHVAGSDCFGCHMPRIRAEDAPHASFTDHWIRVVSGEAPAPQTPSSEPLLPYFSRDKANREGQAYLGLALIAHGRQTNDPLRMATGIATLEAGLEADTSWSEAQFLLGVAYHQLGRPDLAVPYLERAARQEPESPRRLAALAKSYEATNTGNRRIEPLYTRALTIQPALEDVRRDYGHYLQRNERLREAMEQYLASLDELSWQPETHILLATALLESRQENESRKAFAAAVHLDPSLVPPVQRILTISAEGEDSDRVAMMDGLTGRPSTAATALPYIAVAPADAVTDKGTPAAVSVVGVPPGSSVRVLTSEGLPVAEIRSNSITRTADWDLTDPAGSRISSGLYLLQIKAPASQQTPRGVTVQRVIVVRTHADRAGE